jgi:hypothetical protein
MTTTQNAAYPLETFGPYGAIPQGTGGYQIGAGNITEADFGNTSAPVSIAATATLTADQVLNGLILANSGVSSGAQTYTLPTVALFEAAIPSAVKVGATYTFRLVNLGTSTATAIVATATGWTITGSLTMTIPVTTGATLIARKSGAGAWTLYRVA